MTGEEPGVFGTLGAPSPAVSVELGRMGAPGDPGERAVRLRGVDGEIVLTDPGAALELMNKLRRAGLYLAGR